MEDSTENGDTCTVRALDLDGDKTVEHPIIPGFRSARGKDKVDIGWISKTSGRGPHPNSHDVTTTKSVTLPPLQRSVTDLGSIRTMYKRPKSPTPNFTMINKRDPDLLRTPDFNSLVTTSRPIPNLLDKPRKEKDFPKKSLNIWKDEVRKVVPSRPPIAITSDWQAPPAEWDDRDQYIYGAKPIFYKNLKYTVGKDFVVNPEWLSEYMTVSTYSKAYRTCALRYGWCA